MTDWFRSWHGAPTDPKWVLIGRKAGIAPAVASAIAWALFDHASQATPRGDVSGFDCEVYAAWGGLDDETVSKALEVMRDRGMIVVGMLANWHKRQPDREDGSAERAKAWRERNKTQQNQDRTQTNANERIQPTDTDTDKKIEQKERKKETRVSAPPPLASNDLQDFKSELASLDQERIESIIKHRRSKRGQLTGYAARLFIGDAKQCGLSLAEAVDTCVSRGWLTVKPEYLKGKQSHSPPPRSPTKARNASELATQILNGTVNERDYDFPEFGRKDHKAGFDDFDEPFGTIAITHQ